MPIAGKRAELRGRMRFWSDLSEMSTIVLLLLGLLVLQVVVIVVLAIPMITPGAKEPEKSNHSCANKEPKVIKCCPFGKLFDLINQVCIPNNGTGELTEVPKRVTKDGIKGQYEKKELQLINTKIECIHENSMYPLNPAEKEEDSFLVSTTGVLQLETEESGTPPELFCLEYFNSTVIAIVCGEQLNQEQNDDFYYVIGLYLSVVFMVCTFLVYALIRELQNLQGKSLMCQLATLTMAYVGLLVANKKTEIHDTLCIILPYFVQFSFLAYFYWLNVMCFDLWWIFSGQKKFGKNSKLEPKKFKIYSIYAWGCSTIIVLFTCFLQYVPVLSGSPSPKDREDVIIFWLSKDNKDFSKLYFFGPIITLIIFNLSMFAHTTVILLRKLRQRDKMMRCAESRRNNKKETRRFVLFLKLFLVMGVSWLGESLQWFYKTEFENFKFAVFVIDAVQLLRGMLIFLMFVCTKKIFVLLNQKLYPKIEMIRLSNSTSTSSSQNHSNPQKVMTNEKNLNQI